LFIYVEYLKFLPKVGSFLNNNDINNNGQFGCFIAGYVNYALTNQRVFATH